MYMQRSAAPVVQQVLSISINGLQKSAVQRFCTGCKTSLRRTDNQSLSGKIAIVIVGQSVNRVTFRHVVSPLAATDEAL
jgi:hypothetical protein